MYSDREGTDRTARARAATVVMRAADGVVLASLPGPAWRRPDLGLDAAPVDAMEGLVGAGLRAYVPFGATAMSLGDESGRPLLDPAGPIVDAAGDPTYERITVSRLGVLGRTVLDGIATEAEWTGDGVLLSRSAMISSVVGVRGETTFLLSGIPGRRDSTWLRVIDEPGSNLWVAQVDADPTVALAPLTSAAGGTPTVHTVIGATIVVREPDGLVAYR